MFISAALGYLYIHSIYTLYTQCSLDWFAAMDNTFPDRLSYISYSTNNLKMCTVSWIHVFLFLAISNTYLGSQLFLPERKISFTFTIKSFGSLIVTGHRTTTKLDDNSRVKTTQLLVKRPKVWVKHTGIYSVTYSFCSIKAMWLFFFI